MSKHSWWLVAALAAALLVLIVSDASTSLSQEASGDLVVPFKAEWEGSAHADKTAEAFIHWDEDDPAEVPARCAKCHSTPGYLDFIGADGSAAGAVDKAAAIGSVITCQACHNDVTMTSVTFPSGVEVTGLGREARCMQCHQGRASGASVDASIERAGLSDDDTVSTDLGFVNIHYFAAGASLEGTVTKGGYQYEGKSYDANLAHVSGYNSCIGCHNPHTLEIKVNECTVCHTNVMVQADVKDIRMQGSQVDYDGDGNLKEGIFYELEGLRAMLYQAMQTYANEVSKKAVAYDSHSYPYFFADKNNNGEADKDEAIFPNRYNAWTGRLAKAAYNYQTSLKDPGAFAHGGKYIIQLLYDSIEDLNSQISKPIDLAKANRIDAGHFAGSEEAFRHWDEDGAVPGSCAKCHSADGQALFLREGVNVSAPMANGFLCANCHDSLTEFTRHKVEQVRFPSGAVVDSGNPDTNLCMNCHQGRQSTVHVNNLIKGLNPDNTSDKLRFLNIHYFAAGATLFGGEAKGAYQYDGKSYVGRFAHVQSHSNCVQCHTTHALTINLLQCDVCHQEVEIKTNEDLRGIRKSTIDYDGDGDLKEGLASEIATLQDALYNAIQDYANTKVGMGIIYDSHSYPYFFTDKNKNRRSDAGEAIYPNRYNTWTPRLLQAAYNYQYVAKDPGAFAHNGKYILQILYDSLEGMGVDMSGKIRP